jgi:hypothetical protein
MTAPDDPAGGWKTGDRVRFMPRFGFDAHLHSGTIVAVEVGPGRDGEPSAHFTVQVDPADGTGRVQLDLGHLLRP